MNAPSKSADGKRVLLGVTGGIAAYKALDVIGRLQDHGAEVRVVMTESATKLIQPLTFEARSGFPVLTNLWDPAQRGVIEHIDQARWADLLLVAPLTANTLAKFVHGLADDALSTLHLAYRGPALFAPAMNTAMFEHPATASNLERLAKRGGAIVGPVAGRLACGEVGMGKMAPVDEIVAKALLLLTKTEELSGRRILVTAGPTREPLDPVRYLTNRSSGKMGYALAAEAARRGADVVLVSGPTDLPTPAGVVIRKVVTADEMHRAVMAECDDCDGLIFCAAVADYRPAETAAGKIKKTGRGRTLRLTATKDIAFETSKRMRPGQLRVLFAAETERLEESARAKMKRKRCDFVVANDVSGPSSPFGSDRNTVLLLGADGRREPFDEMPKASVARRLFDAFAPSLLGRTGADGPSRDKPRKRQKKAKNALT